MPETGGGLQTETCPLNMSVDEQPTSPKTHGNENSQDCIETIPCLKTKTGGNANGRCSPTTKGHSKHETSSSHKDAKPTQANPLFQSQLMKTKPSLQHDTEPTQLNPSYQVEAHPTHDTLQDLKIEALIQETTDDELFTLEVEGKKSNRKSKRRAKRNARAYVEEADTNSDEEDLHVGRQKKRKNQSKDAATLHRKVKREEATSCQETDLIMGEGLCSGKQVESCEDDARSSVLGKRKGRKRSRRLDTGYDRSKRSGRLDTGYDRSKRSGRLDTEHGCSRSSAEVIEGQEMNQVKSGAVTSSMMMKKKQTVLKNKAGVRTPKFVTCNSCGTEFSSSALLYKHKHIVHTDELQARKENANIAKTISKYKSGKYSCNACKGVFSRPLAVIMHVKSEHPALLVDRGSEELLAEHVCTECGLSYKWKQSLTEHMRHAHGENNTDIFYCQHCSETFKSKLCMERHINSAHSDTNSTYKCEFCSQAYGCESSLVQHVQNFHRKSHDIELANCSLCNDDYTSKMEFLLHMNEKHSDETSASKKSVLYEKKVSCDQCNKTFECKSSLLTHNCNTSSSKTFSFKGPDSYQQEQSLETHTQTLDRPSTEASTGDQISTTFSCALSGEIYAAEPETANHDLNRYSEFTHTLSCEVAEDLVSNKAYSCEHCNESYPSDLSLLEHINDAHSKTSHQQNVPNQSEIAASQCEISSVQLPAKIKCEFCRQRYRKKEALQAHIEAVHKEYVITDTIGRKSGDESLYSCPFCDEPHESSQELDDHIRQDHPETTGEKQSEKNEHRCQHCGNIYKWRQSLAQHMARQHGNKWSATHRCTQCGKCYKWRQALCRHMEKEHGAQSGKRHDCKDCGQTYKWKQSLLVHMRTEHNPVRQQNNVSCPECNKVFKNQLCLSRHTHQVHASAGKQLQCNICWQMYKSRRGLVLHKNKVHSNKQLPTVHCHVCRKEFQSRAALIKHFHAKHNTLVFKSEELKRQPVFPCNLCKQSYCRLRDLENHMNETHSILKNQREKEVTEESAVEISRHEEERSTSKVDTKLSTNCESSAGIGSTAINQGGDDTHRVNATPSKEPQFNCLFCPAKFCWQHTLDLHISTGHAARAEDFHCLICNKRFNYKDSVKYHIRTVHLRENGKMPDFRNIFSVQADKFVCNFCSESFDRQAACTEHVKLQHKDKKEVASILETCTLCGFQVFGQFYLKRHVRSMHEQKQARTEICDVCGAAFYTPRGLREHMVKHTEERKFKCQLCSKAFKTQNVLSKHVRTHSNQERHECQVCHKLFKSKNSKIQHMNSHERKFVCKHCNRAFPNSFKLEAHIKTVHLQLREFTCEFCSKAFTTKLSLISHIQGLHTAEKSFVCELCGKKFGSDLLLRRHSRYHDLKHQCSECPKAFYDSTSLNAHMLSRHNIGTGLPCQACGRQFSSRRSLKDHKCSTNGTIVRSSTEHCWLCAKPCPGVLVLQTHMQEVHGVVWDMKDCRDCGKHFSSSSARKRHEKSHGKLEPSRQLESHMFPDVHARSDMHSHPDTHAYPDMHSQPAVLRHVVPQANNSCVNPPVLNFMY